MSAGPVRSKDWGQGVGPPWAAGPALMTVAAATSAAAKTISARRVEILRPALAAHLLPLDPQLPDPRPSLSPSLLLRSLLSFNPLVCLSFFRLFSCSFCRLPLDFCVSEVAGLRSWQCCAPYWSRVNILRRRLLRCRCACIDRGESVVDLLFLSVSPQTSTCFHLSPNAEFCIHKEYAGFLKKRIQHTSLCFWTEVCFACLAIWKRLSKLRIHWEDNVSP